MKNQSGQTASRPAGDKESRGVQSNAARTPRESAAVSGTAEEAATTEGAPGPWAVKTAPLESYEYRWASMKYRVDSPSWPELERQGWEVEHVDPRYGTHLMRRRIQPPPTRLGWGVAVFMLAIQVILLGSLLTMRGCERMVQSSRMELVGVE